MPVHTRKFIYLIMFSALVNILYILTKRQPSQQHVHETQMRIPDPVPPKNPGNHMVDRYAPSRTRETICNVFDIKQPTYDTHECLVTKWNPPMNICIHPVKEDIYVSASLKRNGYWEKNTLQIFQKLLEKDPELGVLDIGANIGVYSLLAAVLNRPTVAVEASILHIQMIHHAIVLNNLQDANVVLVNNAISDSRGRLQLYLDEPNNQGHLQVIKNTNNAKKKNSAGNRYVNAITMDDLIEVVHFKKAMIKMDIEGSEHKAIAKCEKLLKHVYIPYIFMEVAMQLRIPSALDLIKLILERNGYKAFDLNKRPLLNTKPKYSGWPGDMIWKHRNALF